ncbi:undecaprenyl-phosphate glucose phosphotransferase [Aestuariivirga litoralis]|uniref:undecaprenyl-phosphate glucose phosphotransferase n=1 Tax=Aestuariivirga litoralis TaxID=2650924 RepID=UPI0018C454EA|nr:undecaprenyl-phosphate glucose phosphotransferase [Aestuariivirga litoralis]MBG1232184.1 undecaprenyl-phosphate glucose phosphotransferase [Aestuariivirga litoralis]
MRKRYLDREVAMRLLKGLDLLVLIPFNFILSTLLVQSNNPQAPVIVGFQSLAAIFIATLCVRSFKLYEPTSLTKPTMSIIKTFLVIAVSTLIVACAVRFADVAFIRPWLPLWCAGCFAYVLASRLFFLGLFKGASGGGKLARRIAIVGGGKAAEDAINTLERSKSLEFDIVGLFDDRTDKRSPASVRKYKKLGKIADLAAFHRDNPVDLIIVAIPISAELRLMQILKSIWELPVDIRVSGQSAQLKLSPRAYDYLGELPLLAVFDRPLSHWNEFLKNQIDRLIALCAIICLSPVMGCVALAVRIESKGPAIFKQKRYGFNNELIEVYKFRSMYVDQGDANAAKLVTKGDPRVTSVGRIIRKTSLDELPQLFNVLKGQLALVGPRPHATQAKAAGGLYDQVVDGYFARHKVRPGITGWAQINGWRGETDTVEKIAQRVKHDLEYIDRWSLGLDFYILFKTPFALLRSENAY